MPPFSKILVANRGEIAVRVIRACRELGIRSVAVYSEADRTAQHVRLADETVEIGPAPAAASYLVIEKIIAAAQATGAEAVHPGYGFLAENAAFAQAVMDAGLVFIGPPPGAIEAMGDKARARALMEEAGVPVVPGYDSAIADRKRSDRFSDSEPRDQKTENRRIAESLNQEVDNPGSPSHEAFPLLVKAAAGGGGKGMRIAESPEDLVEAIAAAKREAQHAFGDDRVILEKYIPRARHIEFQVLADQHGNTIHLNERECSVQRRHQKIIEETPSPLLDAALRAEMGAAAVAAAEAVGYANAGTIEFIVDPDTRAFYFIEMNTRLQVEHPITELTTGLDLVQLQISIAAGERLADLLPGLKSGAKQVGSADAPTEAEGHQIGSEQAGSANATPAPAGYPPRGHAIECRIYAEDPAAGFLPAAGPLLKFIPPEGPGIRVDSGVVSGDEVSTYYDPLLAKIVVHAPDRPAAIRRMQTALRETVVLGLRSNLDFLQAVLRHPVFQDGEATTRFIETHLEAWQPESDLPIEALIAAALFEDQARPPADQNGAAYDPWKALTGFRIGGGGA